MHTIVSYSDLLKSSNFPMETPMEAGILYERLKKFNLEFYITSACVIYFFNPMFNL